MMTTKLKKVTEVALIIPECLKKGEQQLIN